MDYPLQKYNPPNRAQSFGRLKGNKMGAIAEAEAEVEKHQVVNHRQWLMNNTRSHSRLMTLGMCMALSISAAAASMLQHSEKLAVLLEMHVAPAMALQAV